MADTKDPKHEGGAPDPGAAPRGKEPKQEAGAAEVAGPRGTEQAQKAQKKEKKGKKGPETQAPKPEPQGPPPEPAPPARLHEYYEQKVRPKLAQQFGLENPHEIPKLVKVVLNVGMGDAPKNPNALEAAGGGRAGQHRQQTGGARGQK